MVKNASRNHKILKKREEKLYVFLVGPLSEATIPIDSLLVLGLW